MKIIENSNIKEKVYIQNSDSGLKMMCIPKKDVKKKYIIFGVKYGSNNDKFIPAGEEQIIEVPRGVAHFLEHKMFEQKNGRNSLDTLTSLGVNANAYTTNNHTAYLYECTDRFYEALDEFMDYIQNPYFTDENVEKEKGIIAQEIKMYDDYPEWAVYLNALKAMYKKNPVKLDIAGSVESISEINKEILYKCYNNFYDFKNACIVVCGDFEPEKIFEEIEKRIVKKEIIGKVKTVLEDEEKEVVEKVVEKNMNISMPLFTIGIKDNNILKDEKVKKDVAMQILLNLIIGDSSDLYSELYKENILFDAPSISYEFGENYGHVLISGGSMNPEKVYQKFESAIQKIKNDGIDELDFQRIKKMLYGEYVKSYNDVSDIARMILVDYMNGIESFDYLEEIEKIDIKYVFEELKNTFKREQMVLSVIK